MHLLQLKHIDLKFLMMMGSLEMTRRTNLSGLAVLHSQNWVRKLWNCGKRSYPPLHFIVLSEEAFATRLPLTITDKRWGRKSGSIIITELRRTQSSSPSSAYPPSLSSPYPSQTSKAAEVNVFSEGTSSAGGFVIPSRI